MLPHLKPRTEYVREENHMRNQISIIQAKAALMDEESFSASQPGIK